MNTFFKFQSFEVDESLTFPDGQPHVNLIGCDKYIYCRIANPTDLVKLALIRDVVPYDNVHLFIAYLMGARMDRPLSRSEPMTLRAIANVINSMNFKSVSIFCPHSDVTIDCVRYSSPATMQEACFYDRAVLSLLGSIPEYRELLSVNDGSANIRESDTFSIVYPDKGACARMSVSPFDKWYKNTPRVVLEKHREERTGKILGMKIANGDVTKHAVIIDDLCDGGATFRGAAKCLRENGAEKVFLAVCHGVFSKGLPIEGVDLVCTTDSYCHRETTENLIVHPVLTKQDQ